MNSLLAKKLIEKGAIRQGTKIEIWYNAHGLSCVDNANITGNFIIDKATYTKDDVIFYSNYLTNNKRILSEQIIAIDGMDINRFSKIYNLTINGEDIALTKRRGRKPKHSIETDIFDEDEE